jgi:hypothetical protein
MGRKRREADKWMPKRVYRGRSAFEWRPKGGGCVRLCQLDAKREDVWDAYRRAKIAAIEARDRPVLMGDILDQYFASPQFAERPGSTQADYRQSAVMPCKVFGSAAPEAITAPVARQYTDRRGAQSRTRANRERSTLGIVWGWGLRTRHHQGPLTRSRRPPLPQTAPRTLYHRC